ncbi:MAG: MFS transporter [Bacillota bacterium]
MGVLSTVRTNRDFTFFWLGQSISVLGTAVSSVAIPWLTLDLTRSAAQAGLMAAVGFVPYLLITLPAGVWADRLDRRRLMVLADVTRAVLMGSIPLASALGILTIAHLYIVQAGVSAGAALFDVGQSACLPNLVERGQLQQANSRLQAAASAARIAGPAAAGVLVSIFGAAITVSADSLSYVVSVVTLMVIRRSFQSVAVRPRPKEGFLKSAAEGLSFLWRDQLLRALVMVAVLTNFGQAISGAIEVFRVKEELALSSDAIGLIFATGSVGSLIAALASEFISRRFRAGGIIVVGVGIGIAGGVLLAIARTVPVFAAAAFLTYSSGVILAVQTTALRQTATPDQMLGRVSGASRLLTWGLIPVGSALGGLLAQRAGAVATLWLSAAILALSLVWVLGSGLFIVKGETPGNPVSS